MDAKEIKAIRLKLGLSQSALAERMGVSVTTVHYWESGLRNISKTAEILLLILAKRK